MQNKTPAARPRTSGGFNQQLGDNFGEAYEDRMMQQALGQKASNTQASNTTNTQTQKAVQQQLAGKKQKARAQGSLFEELIKYPAQDVWAGLKSIFDINSILGIKTGDTPEEQAKKQQLHQRFQQLTKEEQAYAQQKYQQEMQKKQQKIQEEEAKKQQEEQAKAQKAIAPPSSPKKGPVGPAGKSSAARAKSQLEMDRKAIGKVGSAN